ncbi:MAG: MATE family efflux transporter, partial [Clostridiales bacterium]|nr:MATE family efflux transporter [Clostridiales bacterium]
MNQTPHKKTFRERFIGDKAFYRMVLAIAVPIMIQNGITNFVSLLDNIMIGRIGTEQMSGAAIVNQLIFVYNLCIFGGVSGAGIFTAQYFGQGDEEGIRQTFRYKLWLAIFLTAGVILLFLIAGEALISMYLNGEGNAEAIVATRNYGMR